MSNSSDIPWGEQVTLLSDYNYVCLYYTNTLGLVVIVIVNSPCCALILNAACLSEKKQISI